MFPEGLAKLKEELSEADKMFEDLDYEKVINNEEVEEYMKKDKLYSYIEKICVFDQKHHLLNLRTKDFSNYQTVTTILSIKEIQAINKKMEELGLNG